MKGCFARAATAATLVLLTATGSFAAGARIHWRDASDAERYRLFVAQPNVDDELEVRELDIDRPKPAEDGTYYHEVHGIDPSRPTLVLMVGINWQGLASPPSNIIELDSEGFCEWFDVDRNGAVTPSDALAVARKAVGLSPRNIPLKGSIITALEILKLAATSQCR
jgi:hypothetical protein